MVFVWKFVFGIDQYFVYDVFECFLYQKIVVDQVFIIGYVCVFVEIKVEVFVVRCFWILFYGVNCKGFELVLGIVYVVIVIGVQLLLVIIDLV